MGKKARTRGKATMPADGVGPRQPCPCGSGKRYKSCHGNASSVADTYVVRTFEGLPGECDWVAMREFVPAAKARISLQPDAFDGLGRDVTASVVTVLPGIAPAQSRADGEVWVALQVTHRSGDPSRDLADALRLGIGGTAGSTLVLADQPTSGLRLQDVVDASVDFDVELFDGFEFWFDGSQEDEATVAATLEQLNSSIDPTTRLSSVDAAYWTSIGTKEHLRWVMPYEEERLLTALSRLHVAGADRLDVDTRLVGSFRAHGLLVPVWDLPVGSGAERMEQPATAFAERLTDALADDTALSEQERSARNGLTNRQITIR